MKGLSVSISSYGNYSKKNYGVHAMRVDIGVLSIWFSYQTPMAYRIWGQPIVVSENGPYGTDGLGKTTGRHLAEIDGGGKAAEEKRLKRADFEAGLQATLEKLGLAL